MSKYQVKEIQVKDLPPTTIGQNPRLYGRETVFQIVAENFQSEVLHFNKADAQAQVDKMNEEARVIEDSEPFTFYWSEYDRPKNSRVMDNRHRNWRRR